MQAFDQLLQPTPPHRLLLVPSSAAASQDEKFTILFNQLHLNRIANLCPGPRQEFLLQLAEPRAGCADQVVGWRLRSPHLGQHGFRRDATVHYPSAPGFAILDLDPPEEVAQRRLVRGIARHYLVSQRETLWGHDQGNDHLSRSLVALDQNSTIIAVVELSQSSWLVGGMLPGIERQPCKKLEPSPERLLAVLHRWRDEAVKGGRTITRIALAFEAGRDGFWLARWLAARDVEAHVIHPASVAVSREHRRAKTDRLDTELLKRGFLGWLRGERGHCSMVRVPTIAEEDAKRPSRERDCLVGEHTRIVNRIKSTLTRLGIRNFKPTLRKAAERLASVHTPEGMRLPPNTLAELQRDMARLSFVESQIREIEEARQKLLEQQHETGAHAMVRQLARIVGVGVETADLLVHELLSRPMRDRRAVARGACPRAGQRPGPGGGPN